MKNTFELGYKLRYSEIEDWGSELIKADSIKQALNIFAKSRKILTKKFKSFEDWTWEEGIWFARFKNINQVEVIKCPNCGGTGSIHV